MRKSASAGFPLGPAATTILVPDSSITPPRAGIFLGGTGPPTSVFDRERPILRVRQVPDHYLRARGAHPPCTTAPPPSVFARPEASFWVALVPAQRLRPRAGIFWVALVPRPVSSIASDPSTAPTDPRPLSSSARRPSSVCHSSSAQRLRPRAGIFWVALVPRPVFSIASDPSTVRHRSPPTAFERAAAILRVPQVHRRASSHARRHFSGWHWSPDQCPRSRAIHPPCATVPRPSSSNEPRPSSVCPKSATPRRRPYGGIFLGGTGPPTSVFDRERPIHRLPQAPRPVSS